MDTEWTAEGVVKNLDHHLGLDKLILWPNSVLNGTCEPVTDFAEALILGQQLIQVMVSAGGIGIAAPQIGINKMLIAIGVEDTHILVANPVIHRITDEEVDSQEGCLSFPNIFVKIKRFKEVGLTGNEIVNAENRNGSLVTWALNGKAAIVAQHETDHINGITMVDGLSRLKREIIRTKMLKAKKKNRM